MTKRRPEHPSPALSSEYGPLLAEIKERVRNAQLAAFRAVNKELVALYWDIGRMIVERKLDAAHGDAVAERLAEDLRTEFPGIAGFSRRNVFHMREFYVAYRDQSKVQPLVAQIGWTHNLIILQRCSDPLAREFYIRMTRKFGWSQNVLIQWNTPCARRRSPSASPPTGSSGSSPVNSGASCRRPRKSANCWRT